MTTKDYQKKSPLIIFLHYFKNHKKLFAVDMLCALVIAAVDLTFPLVTRTALYDWLPNKLYAILIRITICGIAIILVYITILICISICFSILWFIFILWSLFTNWVILFKHIL